MLHDRHVPFRREDFIADVAVNLRALASNENFAYFDIISFVETILLTGRWKTKGELKVTFFDAGADDDLAFVSFNPLTLHIDHEVWRLAKEGEPKARFIVAHEIGHIVLHENDTQHFSTDPSIRITFASEEHSAEWQANVFASYFLVPPRLMSAYDTAEEMMASCLVEEPLFLDRHANSIKTKYRRVVHDGALCARCGNLSVTSDGVCRSNVCSA